MCKCTPAIRTPFCGKLGCEWPNNTTIKWEFDRITLLQGYTGPLSIAANADNETGGNNVILIGNAYDLHKPMFNGMVRVRMAMTPEEAEDLAVGLLRIAKAAKGIRE